MMRYLSSSYDLFMLFVFNRKSQEVQSSRFEDDAFRICMNLMTFAQCFFLLIEGLNNITLSFTIIILGFPVIYNTFTILLSSKHSFTASYRSITLAHFVTLSCVLLLKNLASKSDTAVDEDLFRLLLQPKPTITEKKKLFGVFALPCERKELFHGESLEPEAYISICLQAFGSAFILLAMSVFVAAKCAQPSIRKHSSKLKQEENSGGSRVMIDQNESTQTYPSTGLCNNGTSDVDGKAGYLDMLNWLGDDGSSSKSNNVGCSSSVKVNKLKHKRSSVSKSDRSQFETRKSSGNGNTKVFRSRENIPRQVSGKISTVSKKDNRRNANRMISQENENCGHEDQSESDSFTSTIISTFSEENTPSNTSTSASGGACYLIYEPASSGRLVEYYSHSFVPNAIGMWVPGKGKKLPDFKYRQNSGRVILISNCSAGVQGRKNYASGWCSFVRSARLLNGDITLWNPNRCKGLLVDVYVYNDDKCRNKQTVKLQTGVARKIRDDSLAVACVPQNTRFYKGMVIGLHKWLADGNTHGASSKF